MKLRILNNFKHKVTLGVGTLLCMMSTFANASDDNKLTKANAAEGDFSLEILHINDFHSYLAPESQIFSTPYGRIHVDIGGVSALSSIIKEKRKENPDIFLVTAGDLITGNAANYNTFKGEADAAVYAEYDLEYYTLGNHEFDHGSQGLRYFAKYMSKFNPKVKMVISNLEIIGNSSISKYINRYAIHNVKGHEIAIMGVTDPKRIYRTSKPGPNLKITDSVTEVNKLSKTLPQKYKVLITHLGYDRDLVIAPQLDDIDVIIGGDSHTLCGDFTDLGLNTICKYPVMVKNKSGKNLCIVQAYEYAKAIGDLNITFDKNGDVIDCGGITYIPVWSGTARFIDSKNELDVKDEISAFEASRQIVSKSPELVEAKSDPQMDKAMKPYLDKIHTIYSRVVGQATEPLCSVRNITDNCNIKINYVNKGSETCQVISAVILDSIKADMFIANSGAFRNNIYKGDLSLYNLSSVIPYVNQIKLIDIRGDELYVLFNELFNYLREDVQSYDGAFPCGVNVMVHYDKSLPENPVKEIYVNSEKGYQKVIPHKIYRIATFEYTASGSDGYSQFAREQHINTNKVDLDLLVDYLLKHKELPKLDTEHMLLQPE
jgi:5'-nucleotidase